VSVEVGDPDPTPTSGGHCWKFSADAQAYCTERPDHDGQHVAGNCTRVLAVWS
jgi:hypothetical protein